METRHFRDRVTLPRRVLTALALLAVFSSTGCEAFDGSPRSPLRASLEHSVKEGLGPDFELEKGPESLLMGEEKPIIATSTEGDHCTATFRGNETVADTATSAIQITPWVCDQDQSPETPENP